MSVDIKDGETAEIYIAMIKAVNVIEATGEITKQQIENLDRCCWIWLMEREKKEEGVDVE